mmetsp:Transcript_162033/g.299028  ORF Transcript_162033/g.299028 Transcript_162033/m.299028 type:complete len:451 (-) Transcript_162033:76-1428(-)
MAGAPERDAGACSARESRQAADPGRKPADREGTSDEARSKKAIWLKMKERCEVRSSMQENQRLGEGLKRRSYGKERRGSSTNASTFSGPQLSAASSSALYETGSSSDQSSWTADTSSSSFSGQRNSHRTLYDLVLRSVFGKVSGSSDSSGEQAQPQSTASSSDAGGKQPRSNGEESDCFDELESVPDECDFGAPQEVRSSGTVARPTRLPSGPGGRFSSAGAAATDAAGAASSQQKPANVSRHRQLTHSAVLRARWNSEGALKRSASAASPKVRRGSCPVAESGYHSEGTLKRSASALSPKARRQSWDPQASDDSAPANWRECARLQHKEAVSARASARLMQRSPRTSTAEALQSAISKEITSLEAELLPSPRESEGAQSSGPRATMRTARCHFAEHLFKSECLDGSVDDLFLEYYQWRGKRGLPVNRSGGKSASARPKLSTSSSCGEGR